MESVYEEVLKLMQEDFQSKWNYMKENVVDIEEGSRNNLLMSSYLPR